MEFSVVVPVYNEEQNIEPFIDRLIPVISKLGTYEILFVMDPSLDKTEEIIQKQILRNANVKYLKLSRRFGQPAATMAGIHHAVGNWVVVIDVDLQDPPELVEDLYEKAKEGFEVVYATRKSRSGETWLKKRIASLGYKLINKLSDVQIPVNTGDFRLMSRKSVNELKKLNESNGFLRGMVAYIGFSQTSVFYSRDERFAGSGKYNRYFGSVKIGLNGIIGFSSKPLSYMAILGAFISSISFATGIWYLIQKLFSFNITPGLSITVLLITFLSGIQILSIGLLGEYISRIYDEVKMRPNYIVEEIVDASKLK